MKTSRQSAPQHILIDARMYGPKRWTGIGRYLQNLLAELEQLDRRNSYTVLLGEDNFDEYVPGAPNFRKVKAPYRIYSLGEQWGLWRLLRRLEPDLVHFPAPNAPILWSGQRVTTVHDLTLLFYNTSRYQGVKRLIGLAKRFAFKVVLRVSMRRSATVLTPTQFVKDQLCEYLRFDPRRVEVTPLAISGEATAAAAAQPIDRLGVGDNYVLYVGNSYPYKNVNTLVEAFKSVVAKLPAQKLVIVGRDDFFRLELKAYVRDLELAGSVIFTGAVTDGELASLYAGAALYAYPSLSEGFGLQCLEAMGAGVPVLAARASCLPEVCGEAAEFFDPHDQVELARKLIELLSDSAKRAKLKKLGLARATTFSWRRTAEQTLAAYSSAKRN